MQSNLVVAMSAMAEVRADLLLICFMSLYIRAIYGICQFLYI